MVRSTQKRFKSPYIVKSRIYLKKRPYTSTSTVSRSQKSNASIRRRIHQNFEITPETGIDGSQALIGLKKVIENLKTKLFKKTLTEDR